MGSNSRRVKALPTLKTNSQFAPENRPFHPIGKDRITTIFSGGENVSVREGMFY